MPLIPKSFCTFANNMETTIMKTIYLKLGHFFERDMKNKATLERWL